MAVPASPNEAFRLSLRFFPDYSPRTRLAGRLLRLAGRVGLAKLFSSSEPAPLADLGQSIDEWINMLRGDLGSRLAAAAIVWPPPARSTTRVYAHLLDSTGAAIAFAKLAFTPFDASKVRNEAEALRRLASLPLSFLSVPQVIAEGTTAACHYAVVTPMPPDAFPVPLSWEEIGRRCRDEFAGELRTVSVEVVKQETWWKQFESAIAPDAPFMKDLLPALSQPIRVRRTHGDYLLHNMRAAGNRVWIFDWEEFTENGPHLADEIAFFFCLHRFAFKESLEAVLSAFASAYLTGDAERRADSMLALAFLYGTKAAVASSVVERWPLTADP